MHLLEKLRADQAEISAIRRDIHAHPELAFEEHRTAAIVAERLRALGIETHTGVGKTGVVGVLRAGTRGRMIGLRADMDALPIQEKNDFNHHSRIPGRMHACGHDGHTAMLLGAAAHLARNPDFDGTVVFIFQPAEEGEGGAPAMIADGLFERFPMEAVFGLHNWPGLPLGEIAVHRGPVMACADRFDIEIKGHGAHAAMPHQGIDPVLAGASLVQALQSVVSRNRDPQDAAVLSVTQFHAGDAYNVIPDIARICGTVRAFRPEVEAMVEDAMQRVCAGVGAAFGANVSFEYRRGYPPTINTVPEAEFCARVAAEVCGDGKVSIDPKPSMGAEDFAYFLQEKPGCYIWLGNGPGEGGCTLHNPRYDFNDAAIPFGVAYWVRLVQRWLAPV
ncbi:MAG: M20 family metallopeptidase [Zoogloea sp.]|uniref:M20 aminoacylase family protein n=1 Tax=Zoogloea sp. TaxID=49181 RepID=UPI00260D48E8|nr:M20 aminoacylase family protein [Zoogloea sp.]MDD2990258.1 M20 family metallopeptidase [Zoogloea sp.]